MLTGERLPGCVSLVANMPVIVKHDAILAYLFHGPTLPLSRPSRNQTGSLRLPARQPRALAHCHHLADRQSSVIVDLTKCASKICVMGVPNCHSAPAKAVGILPVSQTLLALFSCPLYKIVARREDFG